MTQQRWTAVATLLGAAAVVIAIAAYRRAGGEPSASAPPQVAGERDPALEAAVKQLESRVAALERAARPPTVATDGLAPDEVKPPTAAPALPEVGSAGSASPASTETPEHYKTRVARMVDTYWRDWADRNHLDAKQTETLAALQTDAAARRLDTQTKVAAKEMSQSEARAANLVITEEVRRKARDLLTPAQFAQFETDRGAELGSSYRAVRDSLTKARAVSPD